MWLSTLVFYGCWRPTFKIIIPFFGYQFNSFKFLVGLTHFDFCRFFYLCPFPFIRHLHKRFWSYPLVPKNLLIISINSMLCYFPKCDILQNNLHVKGSNIDISKLEVRARVQHFLSWAFKKHYIGIWSCMLLEDVMEVLHLLMLEKFVDQFLFIFGCEQCTRILGQLTYYYWKDCILCMLKAALWDRRPNTIH
jgi:hypothetical protein